MILSYTQANDLVSSWIDTLLPHCERLCISGEIRRKLEKIASIDILVVLRMVSGTDLWGSPTQTYASMRRTAPQIAEKLDLNDRGWVENTWRLHYKKMPVIIHVASSETWGSAVAITTGPHELGQQMQRPRKFAGKYPGLLPSNATIKDYGVYIGKKCIPMPREEDFYAYLGIHWLQPELRLPITTITTRENV